MNLDKQRIAAVRALEALGFTYRNDNGSWLPTETTPSQALPLRAEADAMHAALVRRADVLADCAEGPHEEAELKAIVAVIEAYEARRWPDGKEFWR